MNEDLVGHTFEWQNETWTVVGNEAWSDTYMTVRSESGKESARATALIRRATKLTGMVRAISHDVAAKAPRSDPAGTE